MPNDLKGEIHSNFSTDSSTWANFRSEVTGAYILSGQGGEGGRQHLLREFNRKVDNLDRSGQFYLEPYNAGFSYKGTPDLYTGAAGAYSTRTIGFGGPLMRVKGGGGGAHDAEEVDVRGDINGNISLNSPLIPTGYRSVYTGSHKKYYYDITMSGKDYRVTYVKNVEWPDISGYIWDHYADGTASPFMGYGPWYLKLASGQQPEDLGESYVLYPYGIGNLMGGYFVSFMPDMYGTSDGYAVEALGLGTGPLNWALNVDPIYDTLGGWTWDNDADSNSPQTCSIWYDQSATGDAQNNLTQTTAADQPILCSEGVLKVDSSGNTALDFNGSTQHMVLDTGFSSTLNINALSSFTVFENAATGSSQIVSCLGSFADSNKRWYSPYINNGLFNYSYGTNNPLSSDTANTNLNLVSIIADSAQGDAKAFRNGSQVGSAGSLIDNDGGTSLVGVGGLGDSLHFDGKMGEFIIYSSSTESANRVSIETDIRDHFKI